MITLLTSHLGYGPRAAKAVIAVVPDGRAPRSAALVPAAGAAIALTPGPVETGAAWHIGPFTRTALPAELAPGRYTVRVTGADGGEVTCAPFEIAEGALQRQTMSDVLSYFKAMRSSGEIDRKD